MDQIKIGEFISCKRKEKNITQSKLAEMLGITDRAISKWENGICMPDSGTIPELCKILSITINDLFSGEIIDMKKHDKKVEENLLELSRQKELADKRLLTSEIFIGMISSITLLSLILVASLVEMSNVLRAILIVIAIITFAIGLLYALRIEQIAGYYECKECHHKHIPTYINVLFAMHSGRTRYIKCPNCGKKSWNKKVLTK